MNIADAALIDPPNVLPRIERIWAFLSVDAAGNEGLCAAPLGGLGLVPLIAADEARLESLRPIAVYLAARTGKRISRSTVSIARSSAPAPSRKKPIQATSSAWTVSPAINTCSAGAYSGTGAGRECGPGIEGLHHPGPPDPAEPASGR